MARPDFGEHITFLPTFDLGTTEEFYRDKLGLELVLKQPSCTIFRWAGNAYVGFCQKEQVPQPAQSVFLTVICSDLDGLHAWLAQRGVQMDGPPRHNPKYEIVQFFAQDPNGYTLEFQRFDDPNWNTQRSSKTRAL